MTDDTEVQNRAFGGNGINAKTWKTWKVWLVWCSNPAEIGTDLECTRIR